MPWTPWISIEDENASDEKVKRLYAATRNSITRKIPDINRLTSLTPEASELLSRLRDSIYQNKTGLSAREKEIAALVSSSFIGCVH